MKEDIKLYYYVALLTFMVKNIGNQYAQATHKFYECLQAHDKEGAATALQELHRHKYPHSQWQQRHIDLCEQELKKSPRLKKFAKEQLYLIKKAKQSLGTSENKRELEYKESSNHPFFNKPKETKPDVVSAPRRKRDKDDCCPVM